MKTLYNIVAISALSLSMAGSALAQTTPSVSSIPVTWTGVVKDNFFDTGKLRNEPGNLNDNRSALSAHQQARVRAECHRMRSNLATNDEKARLCAEVNEM